MQVCSYKKIAIAIISQIFSSFYNFVQYRIIFKCGNNGFTKVFKNLDTDMKIILLAH